MTLKPIIYASTDPDCPEHLRYAVHYRQGGRVLPVFAHAADIPGCEAKIKKFREHQEKRAAPRKQSPAKGN